MRLLHTKRLTFGEFFGQIVPSYCILSHRWNDDEVLYQDIASGNIDKSSAGYQKLLGACRLARDLGWTWIWIDAACIDKRSSSELGEAINSMMKWYREAEFCIAYLADVPQVRASRSRRQDAVPFNLCDFRSSVWFTRGWTLQELIAPRHVYFYNCAFEFIGSKSKLSPEISEITGIEAVYLDGRKSYTKATIATRMSWSAFRQCTRPEDEAYCLLGIMQVNMPLLYGEGKMAFMRLQLQIISQSDDETIFAWKVPKWVSSDQPFGMLAESASFFAESQHLSCTSEDATFRLPYSFSNKGLEFSQYTGLFTGSTNPAYSSGGENPTTLPGGTYIRPDHQTRITLRCTRWIEDHDGRPYRGRLAIELRQVGNAWYRVHANRFIFTSRQIVYCGLIQTYYIAQPNMTTQLDDGPVVSVDDSAKARRHWDRLQREKKPSNFPGFLLKTSTAVVALGVGSYQLHKWLGKSVSDRPKLIV